MRPHSRETSILPSHRGLPPLNTFSRSNASHARRTVVTHARKDPPDYAERRRGGQGENNRRRINAHQNALSARSETHSVYDGPPMFARPESRKGPMFQQKTRRRGRPAHLRSPDDSPLRDGNRDRVIGLLTERAARTLAYYFSETNVNYHHWLGEYIKQNPIPRHGKWDDVSGETFLRQLLMGGVTEAKAQVSDDLFSCVRGLGIDPRTVAQRIMEIRKALAAEFIQDLERVAEENAILMRECAMASLTSSYDITGEAPVGSAASRSSSAASLHPEMPTSSLSIPDTAAQFLTEATESDLERYRRQQGLDGATTGDESAASSDTGMSSQDEIRPGLDDINEFESELEAPDKWKRRFRLMKQDESSTGGTHGSEPPDKKPDDQDNDGQTRPPSS